jgi:hypothetical protein
MEMRQFSRALASAGDGWPVVVCCEVAMDGKSPINRLAALKKRIPETLICHLQWASAVAGLNK